LCGVVADGLGVQVTDGYLVAGQLLTAGGFERRGGGVERVGVGHRHLGRQGFGEVVGRGWLADGGVVQGRLVVGATVVVTLPVVGGAVGAGTTTITACPGGPRCPGGPDGPDGPGVPPDAGAVVGVVTVVVAADDGVMVGAVSVVGASPSRLGPYRSAMTVPAMMLPASRIALPPRMTSRTPTPVYQRRAT